MTDKHNDGNKSTSKNNENDNLDQSFDTYNIADLQNGVYQNTRDIKDTKRENNRGVNDESLTNPINVFDIGNFDTVGNLGIFGGITNDQKAAVLKSMLQGKTNGTQGTQGIQDIDLSNLLNSTDQTGTNLNANSITDNFLKTSTLINKTALVNADIQSIAISQMELRYYERKVKPLVDMMWSLSYQAENLATVSNLYQANAISKKHEIKRAFDLSNDMLKLMEETLEVLEKRVKIFCSNIDPFD